MKESTFYRTVGSRIGGLVVRRFPRRLGLFELLGTGSIEWTRRHLAIVNELESIRRSAAAPVLTVLDFGGADGSLGRALRLYGLERHYIVTVVDIDEEALQGPLLAPTVKAMLISAGGALPFDDSAFDVAISSDVFEHIPSAARPHWATELGRVSRLGQVHTIPADDGGLGWASAECDREFAAWLVESTGTVDRWTNEHLEVGVPSIRELRAIFPSPRISGIVNAQVWTATMHAKRASNRPWDRIGFVLAYARRLRKLEGRPPYKNALVVVDQV